MLNINNLKKLDQNYILRPWAKKDFVPILIKKAKGVYIWDYNNKKYLDFSSGSFNVNLGYGNKEIIKAISEELNLISFLGPSYSTKSRSELSSYMIKILPNGLIKTFFTSSGSEAIEAAMRFVTEYTKKDKLISTNNSYHGPTFGAASLSGDPDMKFRVSLPGILHIQDPYCYRCVFKSKYPDCNLKCLESLRKILKNQSSNIAALFIEPILGINAFTMPPKEYFKVIRELCDYYNILLVFDEILTGFGRTGKWFACEHYKVKPDIICFGKGINSGYLPMGGVSISKRISEYMGSHPVNYGQTYTAHTVCCAAALATIKFIMKKRLIEKINKKSKIIKKELSKLYESNPFIGDVRGKGFLWVLELVNNKKSKFKLNKIKLKSIFEIIKKNGLMFYSDLNTNLLNIAPPYIIKKEELKTGLDIITKSFQKWK